MVKIEKSSLNTRITILRAIIRIRIISEIRRISIHKRRKTEFHIKHKGFIAIITNRVPISLTRTRTTPKSRRQTRPKHPTTKANQQKTRPGLRVQVKRQSKQNPHWNNTNNNRNRLHIRSSRWSGLRRFGLRFR